MINWKVRFKNKTWLISFVVTVLAFIYQILGLFEITPAISQNDVVQLITLIVNMLAAVGVVVDPTTAGVGDSQRAMTYDSPKKD